MEKKKNEAEKIPLVKINMEDKQKEGNCLKEDVDYDELLSMRWTLDLTNFENWRTLRTDDERNWHVRWNVMHQRIRE